MGHFNFKRSLAIDSRAADNFVNSSVSETVVADFRVVESNFGLSNNFGGASLGSELASGNSRVTESNFGFVSANDIFDNVFDSGISRSSVTWSLELFPLPEFPFLEYPGFRIGSLFLAMSTTFLSL